MKYLALVLATVASGMEKQVAVHISKTEYDLLAERAIAYYLNDHNPQLTQALAPYVAPKLRSPEAQAILDRLATFEEQDKPKKKKRQRSDSDVEFNSFIKNAVKQAMQEAIIEKEAAQQAAEESCKDQCSKTKTLLVTLGTSLATAGVTALITLLTKSQPPTSLSPQ